LEHIKYSANQEGVPELRHAVTEAIVRVRSRGF
jgi:hypothetical protein